MNATEVNFPGFSGIEKQVNFINSTIANQNIIIKNASPFNVTKYPVSFHIPRPIRAFHGREFELTTLKELFAKNIFVVISGMAGIGKSELAKNYILIYHNLYTDNCIWISAENLDSLKKSFTNLGKRLRLPTDYDIQTLVQETYSYFAKKKVLFVFDNAKSRKNIRSYFPSAVNHNDVNILITSQNSNWGSDIPTIKLNILSEDASLKIFKSVLGEKYNAEDEIHLVELAKVLNYIPLPLQISAAYLHEEIRNSEEYSVENYVLKLKKEENILLDEQFPDNSENEYSNTTYIAVKISLENIAKIDNNIAKQAIDLIYFCSYLDADCIVDSDLEVLGFADNLNKILSTLSDYSFITVVNDKCSTIVGNFFGLNDDFRPIQVHRLIQWTLRVHQKRLKIEDRYYGKLLEILVIKINDISNELHQIVNFSNSHQKYIFKFSTENSNTCLNFYKKYKPKLYFFTLSNTQILYLLEFLVQFECLLPLRKIFEYEGRIRLKMLIRKQNLVGIAAQFGHVKVIELLISFGASINSKDDIEHTPLHSAALCLHADAISLLISAGAKVNSRDSQKGTALHTAVLSLQRDEPQTLQCVQVLIEEGNAKIDLKSDCGESALHIAAANVLTSVVEYLLKRGANVHLVDNEGRTALFYVSYAKFIPEFNTLSLSTVRVLIEHGAKLDHVDKYGETSAQFTRSKELISLADYLDNKGYT